MLAEKNTFQISSLNWLYLLERYVVYNRCRIEPKMNSETVFVDVISRAEMRSMSRFMCGSVHFIIIHHTEP